MKNLVFYVLSLLLAFKAHAELSEGEYIFKDQSFQDLSESDLCESASFRLGVIKYVQLAEREREYLVLETGDAVINGTLLSVTEEEGLYMVVSQFSEEVEGHKTVRVGETLRLGSQHVKDLTGEDQLKIHQTAEASGVYQLEPHDKFIVGQKCNGKSYLKLISRDIELEILLPLRNLSSPISRIEVLKRSQAQEEGDKDSKVLKPRLRPANFASGSAVVHEGVTSYFNPFLADVQETILIHGVPVVQSRPGQYVCVSNTLNAYAEGPFEGSATALPSGAQVKTIQGEGHGPVSASKNGQDYTLIHVEYEGSTYWVVQEYIKVYAECPQIQTQAVEVCTENSVNYRGESIHGETLGSFSLGEVVYRYTGHRFSKQVAEISGQDFTFVPVKREQDSEEVFWVWEGAVDYESCPALENSDAVVERTCRGYKPNTRNGQLRDATLTNFTYKVNLGDEFPLQHRPEQSYRSGARMFYAGRPDGRRHAATDLYTPTRGTTSSGRAYGSRIYAINDGVVVAADGFYCQTQEVAVRSDDGYLWRYGEVSHIQVRVGQRVKKGDRLATALHVGACAESYPPMLHLEKYKGTASGALSRKEQTYNKFKRRVDLTNPTCHVQYMERKEFGESY